MAGMLGMGFAVFIEEVGKSDLDYDIMFFEVFFEFAFVFEDGIFESYTIWTNKVGIDDKVVFGINIAYRHVFIPDFFGVGWPGGDAGDNCCNYNADDG